MFRWIKRLFARKPVLIPKAATRDLHKELKSFSKKKLIHIIIGLYNEMQILKTKKVA